MYILLVGWLYVVMMMALAEATNVNGSVLGAGMTFLGYGVLPVALSAYFMGRPARRRRREQQAAAEAAASAQPDARGHAPGAAEPGRIAPVREES